METNQHSELSISKDHNINVPVKCQRHCEIVDNNNDKIKTVTKKYSANIRRPSNIAERIISDVTSATCASKNDLDYNILDKENLYPNSVQSEPFSLQKLNCQLKYTALPQGWSHVQIEKFLVLAHWTANTPAKKEFHIYPDGSIQVYFIS